MTAYLFPGQGSQHVGMCRDLYSDFPAAREIVEEANDMLGYRISDIMFAEGMTDEAAAAELARTNYTQPALYIHSMAAWNIIKDDADPACTAGHSLGEYSALAAAQAISFEDGLRAVSVRGSLMANADSNRPGTMAAIIGLDDDVVEDLCKDISTAESIVTPANYNSPGQVVISGDVDAIKAAMEAASSRGARKVIPLVVGGAFHSPLMSDARAGLSETLERLEISSPKCPVYMNVTGKPETDPEEIRKLLLEQLLAPVRWAQSIGAMQEAGISHFVEVGAGKVLSGLVRRTLGREVEVEQAGISSDAVIAKQNV